jgi:hypothetical protein
MALSQQLTVRLENMSGELVITAGSQAVAELQGLAQELALRPGMTTNGDINISIPETPVPPPGGGMTTD